VPLNAWLKGDFLQYQLTDCEASVLIADDAGLRAAAPLLGRTAIKHVIALDETSAVGPDVELHPYASLAGRGAGWTEPVATNVIASDLASIVYTSGTTGMPKGCMLSHSYYLAGPGVLLERGWVVSGDRLFTAWPLFHTSGQVVALMTALLCEGSVVFEPEFSASSFLDRARADEATVLCGVGFMGAALLAQPPRDDDRDNPFRMATWIPMTPAQQVAFEDRFGVPVLGEAFGQTECFPVSMASVHDPRRRDTLGRPSPHFEVRLVDSKDEEVAPGTVGEIVIRPRSAGVMYSGYWRKPEATVAAWRNLWHHTGDLARADEDGVLSFVDRQKDAVRRRGEYVSSIELEAAIGRHPAVVQVAVCAVASPLGEDDIKACVVLRPGEDFDPRAVFEWLRERLPYFAIPRYLQIRESLPVNALGRVMKQVLRDEGAGSGTWDLEGLGLQVVRGQRR
jgi:crotonobetaine/carnitine-CoA ligase